MLRQAFFCVIMTGLGLWAGLWFPHDSLPAEQADAPECHVSQEGNQSRRDDAEHSEKPSPSAAVEQVDWFDVMAAMPAEKTEQGTGIIQGTVKTVGGRPLPHVMVRANMMAYGDEKADEEVPVAGDDLTDRTMAFIREEQMQDRRFREVKTNARGEFVLPGLLPDEDYYVEAYRDGYEIYEFGYEGWGETEGLGDGICCSAGEVINFTARKLVTLSIDVRLPDGTRPARAILVDEGPKKLSLPAWTPSSRTFHVRPGVYYLLAKAGDRGRYICESRESVILPNALPVKLILNLDKTTIIDGQVVWPNGIAGEAVKVFCLQVPEGVAADAAFVAEHGVKAMSTEVDGPDWRFRFQAWPGIFVLGVGENASAMLDMASVRVDARQSDGACRLTMPPLRPEDFLVVHFHGPSGRLLSDVEIKNYPGVKRQQDGAFWIDVKNVSSMRTLNAAHPIYGRTSVTWTPGEPQAMAVRFKEPAVLEVQMAGFEDGIHEFQHGLNVQVMQPDHWSGSPCSAHVFGETGTAMMAPLQPGLCKVVVDFFDAREEHELTLQSGLNRITCQLPQVYSLAVSTHDIKPGTWSVLKAVSVEAAVDEYRVQVAGDGRAVFENIAPGEYRLVIDSPQNSGAMKISIPGDSTVEFKPAPFNALSVSEEFQCLNGETLEEGDLILGIAPNRFKNFSDIERIDWLARTQNTVTLIVMKDGREMRVKANLRQLAEEKAYGYLQAVHH